MNPAGWNRRNFLGAIGVLLCSPYAWRAELFHRRPAQDALGRLVAELVGDDGAARFIGERYLRTARAERTIAALATPLRLGELLSVTDTKERNAIIARRIRHDFHCRRTTRVDGWILSLTEARLCALAALV